MAFVRNFLQEFKQFAVRGNAIDLAVGIVIGGAFTKIVNSIVGNVINPITAYLMGDTNLSAVGIPLPQILGKQSQGEIGVGSVFQSVVEFVIVALVLFLVIRAMNRLNLRTPVQPAPPEDVRLLREIRDLMATGGRPTL
jgi:large conductance mechanosensitive channel